MIGLLFVTASLIGGDTPPPPPPPPAKIVAVAPAQPERSDTPEGAAGPEDAVTVWTGNAWTITGPGELSDRPMPPGFLDDVCESKPWVCEQWELIKARQKGIVNGTVQ